MLTGCLADGVAVFSVCRVEAAGHGGTGLYINTRVVSDLFPLAVLTLAEVVCDKGGNKWQPLTTHTIPRPLCVFLVQFPNQL